MRFLQSRGLWRRLLPVLALLAIIGTGCGSDNSSEPEAPKVCAITDVNTDVTNSWDTGEVLKIYWGHNGEPSTVRVELLKAGDVVATLAESSENDGFYTWIVTLAGLENGSDFGVRVTGTGSTATACTGEVNDLTLIDTSNCSLTFTAAVDSNGAGDDFEITWDGYHTGGMVDIELWTSFGSALRDLIGVVVYDTPDDGSFSWIVDSFHNGTFTDYRYVIRSSRPELDCEVVSPAFIITDTDICTILVTGILQGSELFSGQAVPIELDMSSQDELVDLRLYSGNEFVIGGQIQDNVSVLETFQWTVSDFGHLGADDAYRIKAINVLDGYCVGVSDRFKINR